MDTPLIDDDHIISLLRKDAQTSRLESSFTAERRDKSAPKPNTRFLRNLVRDADSHNAALLAKEKAETKARLRGLDTGAKRGRDEAGNGAEDSIRKRRREGEREGRWKGVLSGLGRPNARERDKEGKQDRHHRSREERECPRSEKAEKDDAAHPEHRRHRRRRSRSPDSRSRSPHHLERSNRDRRSHRSRSREPRERRRNRSRQRRSASPDSHRDKRAARSSPSPRNSNPAQENDDSASDSDPLTSFLGPAPPPSSRPRGRGAATTNRSTMDLRFNDPSYNPRADVAQSESEGENDDWSTSLEAMRDRAAWREKGAQRLRDAGFGEGDVAKWESGGREKDERDLRWRGRGEGREWDAGKVEGMEGEVRVKAAWTRGLDS